MKAYLEAYGLVTSAVILLRVCVQYDGQSHVQPGRQCPERHVPDVVQVLGVRLVVVAVLHRPVLPPRLFIRVHFDLLKKKRFRGLFFYLGG